MGSVLYIAAHPDDENTRLLTYLAQEKKVRTGYLSLTRGDGGQNLIGNEQAELLGVIRTQELLAARKVDGAEQFFSRAIDFGFSKSAEESLKIWDKEKVLADAVWVIRKFRPDVIITRFPEDSRAGHGQHSASAIIAREAFLAAGDPTKYPEQLKDVQPWNAKRIVWNTFNFGGRNTTSEDQLKIDVGGFNPVLGKSYGEIAAESRSKHKSQGFGASKSRGSELEYFAHTDGQQAKRDLFEGIDLTWIRIKGGEKIAELITKTDNSFNMEDPSKSVDDLLAIYTAVQESTDKYWKAQKEKELKELIVSCAGLWVESYSSKPIFTINETVSINHQYVLRSSVPVILEKIISGNDNLNVDQKLVFNRLESKESDATVEKITQPYWLEHTSSPGTFNVSDLSSIGKPENPDPIISSFIISIKGVRLSIDRPVIYKYTDPVDGEVYQPLAIAPPVTATVEEKSVVFSNSSPKTVAVHLKSFVAGVKGRVIAEVPDGWKVSPAAIDFNFEQVSEERTVRLTITPNHKIHEGNLSLSLSVGDQVYHQGLQTIRYEHIPLQTLFPPAEARVVKVNLNTNGKKIGYLSGAGDRVGESLQQIGYNVTFLNESSVLTTNLSSFDAIILGVRAFNVHRRMNIIQPRLMDYVRNGGNLLIQYNVSGGMTSQQIGPYPFTISRDRVTDEGAKVSFLQPNHPILNYPNKITEADFAGWVQERGLYFLRDLDKNYVPILSMADPGEKTSNGSLIVSDYGKGKFVYTSLSFFRQLPAGVPGAYRLFVNLIAKNK